MHSGMPNAPARLSCAVARPQPGARRFAMELIHADDKARLDRIELLYLQAFPKNERKPFWLICRKKEEGVSHILSIEENNEFLGLAITMIYKDMVLLDYFAMDHKRRGKGYGSAALLALTQYYHKYRMILEIESTAQETDDLELRLRRKDFYHKNGMTDLGLTADLFGVPMELLSNNTAVSFDEYLELYVKTYGDRMKGYVKLICQL